MPTIAALFRMVMGSFGTIGQTLSQFKGNLGCGSIWERSLTEFTLSLSEGFEMTNDLF